MFTTIHILTRENPQKFRKANPDSPGVDYKLPHSCHRIHTTNQDIFLMRAYGVVAMLQDRHEQTSFIPVMVIQNVLIEAGAQGDFIDPSAAVYFISKFLQTGMNER